MTKGSNAHLLASLASSALEGEHFTTSATWEVLAWILLNNKAAFSNTVFMSETLAVIPE